MSRCALTERTMKGATSGQLIIKTGQWSVSQPLLTCRQSSLGTQDSQVSQYRGQSPFQKARSLENRSSQIPALHRAWKTFEDECSNIVQKCWAVVLSGSGQ